MERRVKARHRQPWDGLKWRVREFAPEARASGIGFVIGVGRVSSAIGPLAAGFLFALGLGKGLVSAMFGALAILAALVLIYGTARPADGRSKLRER